MNFFNKLDFDKADVNFHRALDVWAGHFYSYFMSSQIAYLRGRYEDCESLMWDALSQAPEYPKQQAIVHFYLGCLRFETKLYEEALQHFRQAHNLNSKFQGLDV